MPESFHARAFKRSRVLLFKWSILKPWMAVILLHCLATKQQSILFSWSSSLCWSVSVSELEMDLRTYTAWPKKKSHHLDLTKQIIISKFGETACPWINPDFKKSILLIPQLAQTLWAHLQSYDISFSWGWEYRQNVSFAAISIYYCSFAWSWEAKMVIEMAQPELSHEPAVITVLQNCFTSFESTNELQLMS